MNGLFIMFIVVTALCGLFNGYINNKGIQTKVSIRLSTGINTSIL